MPEDRRGALEDLRAKIRAVVPDAEERLSHGMPAFRLPGGVVADFQATKRGGSYYPFSGTTLATVARFVRAYAQTKSALHFTPDAPLPLPLVRRLIEARLAEMGEAPPMKAPARPVAPTSSIDPSARRCDPGRAMATQKKASARTAAKETKTTKAVTAERAATPKKPAPKKPAPKKPAPKKPAPKKPAPKRASAPRKAGEPAPSADDKSAFAPGALVKHDGTYSLVYSDFQPCEAFDRLGIEGGGYTWHGLVEHVLREDAPEALKKLDFDPEGSMFCALSTDLSALHAVARALKKLEDPAVLTRVATTADLSDYD